MKKTLLIIIAIWLCIVSSIKAQTNHGKVILGVSSTLGLTGTGSDLMNLGYSGIKYKSDADGFEESDPDIMTSFNLLPKVGFFIANNLALGLDLNIALSSQKDGEDNYKCSQRILGVGPFIRYYIPSPTVLPFFEVSCSFGELNNKYEYDEWDDDEYRSSVTSYGGGIGIAAPLGDKVTFDIMAGYNSLSIKDKEDNEDNNRTVIGTFGLKLGFTVLLGAN